MLKGRNIYSIALPAAVVLLTISGFVESVFVARNYKPDVQSLFVERGEHIHNAGNANILSSEDLIPGVLDTVYTDRECWLELRIDKQRLYQHWRDGRTETYPVSTGNPNGGPTSLESRPGLFAIFMKVEHHKSSQFNSSNMYHFMPFNQGIGFHSIDGTSYYAHLGVRPSSHGCIRMKHDDAKKLFKDCPEGTLVLVSKGKTARTVSFAPREAVNGPEYSNDQMRWMLAMNLRNLLTGNYFAESRERFIIDPKIIPKSGIYNGYNADMPDKQKIPRSFPSFTESRDKLKLFDNVMLESVNLETASVSAHETLETFEQETLVEYDNQVVKEYFSNPIGVLPYFGPKR